MRVIVFGLLAVAGLATAANADITLPASALHVEAHYALGQASGGGLRAADPNAIYSNVTNFTGQAFVNGGAANQAGNTITQMVMDDLTPNGSFGGLSITTIRFSVANLDTASVTARARIRFWFADGAGGAPGTYYNVPANVGFTFNPFSFAPGVTVLTGTIASGLFTAPTTTIWAGLTFDDNVGTTGATTAQMNNLGVGLFDPPDVGSSTDNFFVTSSAGSFLGTNNPAGATTNFGGSPIANAGWELVVPSPGAFGLLGLGGLVALRRRR